MEENIENITQLLNNVVLSQTGVEFIPLFENCIIDFELTLPLSDNFFEDHYPHVTGVEVIFSNCLFPKLLEFNDNNVKFHFRNCEFNELAIDDVVFEEKTRFRGCTFHTEITFNNTVFKDLLDFWDSTFEGKVIFYKTDFIGTTVFSTATFNENVLFTYSLIDKLAIFRGANFEKGLDLSLAIIPGELGLFDLKLSEFTSVDGSFNNEQYDNLVSENGEIPTKNKRETFRILKKYHLDQKNPVEYEDYSLLESITHRKELWLKLKSKQKDWKSFWDYILLLLNRVSNKHKTNYWRGILFTLVVGLLFFYCSLIATENYVIAFNWDIESFKASVKYFFISLNPTHKYTYLDNENPLTWFYIWDFLGRLFISYGIYQTVQAFRKFR